MIVLSQIETNEVKKMANKRFRITPQGYMVLAAIVIFIIALVLLLVKFACDCSGSGGTAEATATPSASPTATPSADPYAYTTASPDAGTLTTPSGSDTVASPDASSSAAATGSASATNATATSTPSNILTEPTSSMKSNAQDGSVKSDNTNIRKGPGTGYDKVGSYAAGTALKIYTTQDGWYFVQIVSESKYGYVRKDLVKLVGEDQPSDTVKGTVTATTIAFRKSASTDSAAIGQYSKGQIVYIYYKEGDFYYVMVAGSGAKGYMFAEYVKASGTVPDKP